MKKRIQAVLCALALCAPALSQTSGSSKASPETVCPSCGGSENYSTTTTLSVSPTPAAWGSTITLSAFTTGTDGSISFYDGSNLLRTVGLGSGDSATYTTSTLAVGSHSLVAKYSGYTVGKITYEASSSSVVTEVVNPAAQTINFPNPGSQTYGCSPITLSATASSGLAVTYSVTSGPATVSGSTLTITGTGTVVVAANQAGNANYATAPTVTVSFTVAAESQTISFPNPGTQTYGVGNLTLGATASSGLPVSYSVTSGPASVSGNALSITGAGTVVVAATQAGNADFGSATASVTFTVNKAVLTVSANNLSTSYGTIPALTYTTSGFVHGDTSSVLSGNPAVTTTATNTSTVGQYPITIAVGTLAAQNYSLTFVNGTLTVNQATPSITWSPATIDFGGVLTSAQLNATASTPGSFSYTPPAGTVVTGPLTLTATFAPNDTVDYTSASASANLDNGSQIADRGTISLVVDGSTISIASYSAGATPSSIAAALAANASSSAVNVSAAGSQLYLQSTQAGAVANSFSLYTTNYDSTDFSQPSFGASPSSGSLGGDANSTSSPSPIYTVSASYDGVGNVQSYTDSVMGNWSFSYDSLNRLIGGSAAQPGNPNGYYCWGYDPFGNRTIQAGSNAAFATGSPTCQAASDAFVSSTWAQFNANNQITSTGQAPAGLAYDAAGDVVNDGLNAYLYDAEGRICAVTSTAGGSGMIGYVYDAAGRRVGKGAITSWSCDPSTNGYTPSSDYILGLGGEQVTEMSASGSNGMVWQHTNVFAAGQLLATYDMSGLHFHLTDPLGTRRVQTDYAGVVEQTCSSLPYGDGLACSGSIQSPTEHHFTGKERDMETGNDYFGARYYSSAMGRFMSPDWSSQPDALPYADLTDPQTLNLYQYVSNNPLAAVDSDGHFLGLPFSLGGGGTGDAQAEAKEPPCPVSACVYGVVPPTPPQRGLLYGVKLWFVGAVGAVGHHFIPQRYFRNWQPGWARDFANNMTSGPLPKGAKANLNDALQRENNSRVIEIVEEYLADTGKKAEQLTTEDLAAIKDQIKNAGGAIADFNSRLATENPGVRDVEGAFQNAVNVVGESPVGQAAEELIDECIEGACR